jgi:serine/threonine protein kinase
MGTVYEAHDERFENSVALKEVLIDLAKIADPVQQQMVARAFEREAKTLALLHHEAFPHVIDYFSERDHQYLIMELVRGEDLGEQLQARKKPFDFEDVLEWTKQLLDALDYLHTQEQPIIHRDLKPQNMKITARGKVKVLDFGIAKGADNKSSSTITNQTFVAATLNYSPIEQLLRVLDPTFRDFISQRHKEKVEDILEHTADARSDLYSLGATLYQLLTATQPHDTLKRALDIWAGKPDPLPNPIELNPKIPPYFNAILLKSMEIDRDSRYVSAAEMQEAIKQYLKDESKSQTEAVQAAWIAEQQKSQNLPPLPQNMPPIPGVGQQTMVRIAEEQKFLAELDSPGGNVKLDTLSSVDSHSSAPAPFIPQVNEEEERRRIAEQQKFLAELDGPSSAQAERQAPAQQAALTDYGQIKPSYDQPSADQTNYGQMKPAAGVAAGDQTQVSYLAGVLPAQAKADATVINPQVRNEAPTAAVPAPVVETAEPQAKNKLVWLIPVAAVGVFLLIGIVGVLAFVFSSPDPVKNSGNQAQTNSRGNSTSGQTVEPAPAVSETPAATDAVAESPSDAANPSVSSPASPASTNSAPSASKPTTATAQKPVTETPKTQRAQEQPQQQQASRVDKTNKPQPPPQTPPAGKTGKRDKVGIDELLKP